MVQGKATRRLALTCYVSDWQEIDDCARNLAFTPREVVQEIIRDWASRRILTPTRGYQYCHCGAPWLEPNVLGERICGRCAKPVDPNLDPTGEKL